MRVELTARGDLIIPVEVADTCFPGASSVLVAVRGDELWAVRMGDRAVGGLILKQRNLKGDRSVLVVEPLLEVVWDSGPREAEWDEGERALRIPLRPGEAGPGGDRRGSEEQTAGDEWVPGPSAQAAP